MLQLMFGEGPYLDAVRDGAPVLVPELNDGADRTFETLLRRYDLTDPVLWRLVALVHEAELDDARFDAPEAPGFDLALRALSWSSPTSGSWS